jgi:hypothetical protein
MGSCKLHCLKWIVTKVGFSSLLHNFFTYDWMPQKGTHLCEGNTRNISTMKKSSKNIERSTLKGFYMDYASLLKIEYALLFHNLFI